jgi:kinetochore protein Nuf2
MKKHYSFPILDDADILLCLRELQVPVQENDLVNPTPQVVHLIYCNFLDILMNVTREDLSQPAFTSTLEHPELHEDSIPMVTFIKSWYDAQLCGVIFARSSRRASDASSHCAYDRFARQRALLPLSCDVAAARSHQLMMTVGISDFTIKDVLYPERARLRRNFSAVINFAKFREDRMERYQEFTAESDGYIAQKANLETENNKLLAEIRAINAQRASEEPRVAELEAENAQLAAQIGALNQQQAGMKEVAQSLKAKWQEIGDQISETKYTLLSAKQENDSLRNQIVPSPEKLKQARGARGASALRARRCAQPPCGANANPFASARLHRPCAGVEQPRRVDRAREGEHQQVPRQATPPHAHRRDARARRARREKGAAAHRRGRGRGGARGQDRARAGRVPRGAQG